MDRVQDVCACSRGKKAHREAPHLLCFASFRVLSALANVSHITSRRSRRPNQEWGDMASTRKRQKRLPTSSRAIRIAVLSVFGDHSQGVMQDVYLCAEKEAKDDH